VSAPLLDNPSCKQKNALAFFQHRPVFDVNIKQMNLLIALGNRAIFIDPNHSILHLARIYPRFVDPDVDGELLATRLFLKTQYKRTLVDGANKRCALLAGGRNVIARFGEKKSLRLISIASRGAGFSGGC
jgi:hypothetical protein